MKRLSSLLLGAGALTVLAASAQAQETQQTQDTAGMRDTTVQAQADTAGRVSDTTARQAQADTAGQDSTHWGHAAETDPAVQNPPGYRGMERDTSMVPPSATGDTAGEAARVEGRVTGTYDDTAWQDTSGAKQNPPGYRGMERPVGEDTAGTQQQGTDTTRMERGDTGSDTTAAPTGAAGRDTSDTSGQAARGEEGDTGSVAGHGEDSASTRVGETEPVKADEPERRLEPSDTNESP